MRFLKILVLLAVLLNTDDKTFAQKPPEKKIKRNIIEAYIPIIHFFDDHKTNWTYAYSFSHDPTPTYPQGVKGIFRPFTYGLSYSRFNNKKLSGFNVSILNYYINWSGSEKFRSQDGEIIMRYFWLFSLGYNHHLIEAYGIHFWGIGNVLLRDGSEGYYIHGTNNDARYLFDPGISAGIRATKFLPLNLTLTFESYFTQVVYRTDQGFSRKQPYYPFNKGAPRNMLHLNYKLGYRF